MIAASINGHIRRYECRIKPFRETVLFAQKIEVITPFIPICLITIKDETGRPGQISHILNRIQRITSNELERC